MRFCSLKFQNLVRKIDLVNRRWVFYSRAYGSFISFINILLILNTINVDTVIPVYLCLYFVDPVHRPRKKANLRE